MPFRLILLGGFFFWGFLMPSHAKGGLERIEVGGHPLKVEIADNNESRAQGLMQRRYLAEDRGMLFIFEHEHQASFWMKNTRIPLSIAFIAADGGIRQIADMTPFSLESISSYRNVLYALEVNKGWFAERGITEGDKVLFLSF